MIASLKKRIGEILDPAETTDALSRGFNIFIVSLIVFNVIAVILETVHSLAEAYDPWFRVIEVFSVTIFTIEYLLRLWTCSLKKEYANPLTGRLRYAVTPLALIDFLAIAPFYLPMFLSVDLRFLRVMRLFRLLLLFKMARYSGSLQLIGNVIDDKKEELLIALSVTMAMLVLASGVIFYLEDEAQPEVFSSIPQAMWWGVTTMTTVGYGDIYPITPIGKMFGGLVSILGLGTFGLPVGIIAYGFVEEIQKKRIRPFNCPHCGKEVEIPMERRSAERG